MSAAPGRGSGGIRTPAAAAVRSAAPRCHHLPQVPVSGGRAGRPVRGPWDTGAVGPHEADRKTIHHPDVGPLTLDRDVLTVPGSDAADRLSLLTVIGTQDMTEHQGPGRAHT